MVGQPASSPVPAMLDHMLSGSELDPGASVREQLGRYLLLLQRWNQVYNLSAIRDWDAMLERHILDCLAVIPHIRGPGVLDVGSGAGLPGLILAMCRCDWQVTVLDSTAKKTRFCRQVVAELALVNVQVVQIRIEDFTTTDRFDTIIARAYSRVAKLWEVGHHLLARNGRIVAMKGMSPLAEVEELGVMRDNSRIVELNVPGLDAHRHLVIIDGAE